MSVGPECAQPTDLTPIESTPDLSLSNLSRSSSSFRSSLFSVDSSAEDVSHFEDISLDGVNKRDSYELYAHSKGTESRLKAQPFRIMAGIKSRSFSGAEHVSHIQSNRLFRARDNPVEQCPSSSLGRPTQRYVRDVNTTYVPKFSTQLNNSRSPPRGKPIIHESLQRSTHSIPGSTAHSFLSAQHAANRGKIWSLQRKSVGQLEDEFDDKDDDIPDDAIIWNVPISPSERLDFSYQLNKPGNIQTRPNSTFRHVTNINTQLARKEEDSSSPESTSISPTSRRPGVSSLSRSVTLGSLSDAHSDSSSSSRHWHNTWANDLSLEARTLSAALRNFQLRKSVDVRRSSEATGNISPVVEPRRQSTSSSISLPPIQRGEIMIDPQPISKEKEAVLARTRPSWLPPKCRREERKHLKEWEKMMALSVEADKRRATKRLSEIDASRISRESIDRMWTETVLPNWDDRINDPHTRELWWKGFGVSYRGRVWKQAIGNDLRLSASSYNAALSRSVSSISARLLARIVQDVEETFPETGLFKQEAALHKSLLDLVTAYITYRSEVDYSLGIVRMSALLLIHLSDSVSDAFIALANLLNRHLPQAFLTSDTASIAKWCASILCTLERKSTTLYGRFMDLQSVSEMTVPSRVDSVLSSPALDLKSPDETCSQLQSHSNRNSIAPALKLGPGEEVFGVLLTSLFSVNLTLEATCRLWDIYVFEGDRFLVRALVGILITAQTSLSGLDRDGLRHVLGTNGIDSALWKGLSNDVELLIKNVREAGRGF